MTPQELSSGGYYTPRAFILTDSLHELFTSVKLRLSLVYR